MDIINTYGTVLFSAAVETIKDLVVVAVKSGANLRSADLYGANLGGADLGGADLYGANLYGANLGDANLPAPTIVLLARWGEVSHGLTADLMEYDASNHPNTAAFAEWASGGACPYSNVKIQRVANFTEKKELWGKGELRSAYSLMLSLLREKCKTDL